MGRLNSRNTEFIRSLIDENYFSGLKKLYDRTINNDEGAWFGNTKLVSDNVVLLHTGVFEVNTEGSNPSSYRYIDDKWRIRMQDLSSDGTVWWDIADDSLDTSLIPDSKEINQNIMEKLKGKSLIEGMKVLFDENFLN